MNHSERTPDHQASATQAGKEDLGSQGQVDAREATLQEIAEDHPQPDKEDELLKVQEQLLRVQAEMQNARRRAEAEMTKVRKYAVEAFAESLLPIIDSLEAASASEQASAEQLLEGARATHQQLMAALKRNQVVEINPAAGDKFNPEHQHAISMVPSDQAAGTVVSVLQKGYIMAERILRPALVTVADQSKSGNEDIETNDGPGARA